MRIIAVKLPEPVAAWTDCRFAVSFTWTGVGPEGHGSAPGMKMSPECPACPRRVLPAGELGFVSARLEIVIRRYGFEVVPVLWQIVIFVGGVEDGAGVSEADGHAAVPTTTASPVCRMCARSVLPDADFGFVSARLETVMRRHVSEPVLWQIVSFVVVTVCFAASCPCAATATKLAERATAAAINRRFTWNLLRCCHGSCSRRARSWRSSAATFSLPLHDKPGDSRPLTRARRRAGSARQAVVALAYHTLETGAAAQP